MQQDGRIIFGAIALTAIIYVLIRIGLFVNNLLDGAIGHFFKMLPVWMPKTFSETTLWMIMTFFPIAFIYFLLRLCSNDYYFNTIMTIVAGIIMCMLALMADNIFIIPILCLEILWPYLAKIIAEKMVDLGAK